MCIHTRSTHLTQCSHPGCRFHIQIGTHFQVYGFLARNDSHPHGSTSPAPSEAERLSDAFSELSLQERQTAGS